MAYNKREHPADPKAYVEFGILCQRIARSLVSGPGASSDSVSFCLRNNRESIDGNNKIKKLLKIKLIGLAGILKGNEENAHLVRGKHNKILFVKKGFANEILAKLDIAEHFK